MTRQALSRDGVTFEGSTEALGRPYFRVIEHGDYHYALSMPGYMYRTQDGLSDFQEGPRFVNDNMSHNALLIRENTLHVFWSQAGHAPERILLTKIDMNDEWVHWQESVALGQEQNGRGQNLRLRTRGEGISMSELISFETLRFLKKSARSTCSPLLRASMDWQ